MRLICHLKLPGRSLLPLFFKKIGVFNEYSLIMEEDQSEKCLICGENLSGDRTVVQERGISKFIESSRKRKDGKHRFMEGKSELSVHEKCRKSYNQPRSIAGFIKKQLREAASASPLLRSETPPIDFEDSCFLCGELITPECAEKNTS